MKPTIVSKALPGSSGTALSAATAKPAAALAVKPTGLGALTGATSQASHLAAPVGLGAVALHAEPASPAAVPSMAQLGSGITIKQKAVLKTLSPAESARLAPMLHPDFHKVEVGEVKGVADMLHVDRATLSDDVDTRVAQLAKFLACDAIGRDYQVGWYNGMGGGNMPNTELVFTSPGSTTVNTKVKLTQAFGYERDMSTFEVKESDLGPNRSLTAKMLFPTSGHNGFDNALTWGARKGPTYNVSIGSDRSYGGKPNSETSGVVFAVGQGEHAKYGTDNKVVTVSDVTFTGLKKGRNEIYTWPDGTGVGGAPQERILYIDVI